MSCHAWFSLLQQMMLPSLLYCSVGKWNVIHPTQGSHFQCKLTGIMKPIALPGFSDIVLHAKYAKSCVKKACGNHLCSRAAKVHLTIGWYHSSSSEPALAAASLLNTSSIIRRSLTPAQGDHLRSVRNATIRQVTPPYVKSHHRKVTDRTMSILDMSI